MNAHCGHMGLSGRLRVECWSHGQLIDVDERHNRITFTGISLALQLLFGMATTPGLGIAAGTNATMQTINDAGLFGEMIRMPFASVSEINRVGDLATIIIRARMGKTQGNGNTYREAALVTSLTSGQGFTIARVAHADMSKTDQKFLLYQWQLTLESVAPL